MADNSTHGLSWRNPVTDEKMGRRELFFRTLQSVKKTTIQVVDAGIKFKFRRKIIRPPGAIEEEAFLMACTRCENCKNACPYKAIYKIDAISSGVLLNTPFIDPYFEACRFCEDMPCIASCKDGALLLKEKVKPIGLAMIHREHCLVQQGQYCDYCYNSCPNGIKAIIKGDDKIPCIDVNTCVGCGKCAYICVSQTGKAIEIIPI